MSILFNLNRHIGTSKESEVGKPIFSRHNWLALNDKNPVHYNSEQ